MFQLPILFPARIGVPLDFSYKIQPNTFPSHPIIPRAKLPLLPRMRVLAVEMSKKLDQLPAPHLINLLMIAGADPCPVSPQAGTPPKNAPPHREPSFASPR
jgi:hypothetical protein